MPPPTDPTAVLISQYPKEHRHVRSSVALSVGIHLLVSAIVCLVLYWLGFTSLKDLLTHGGAIAENGPAPEEPFLVEIVPEEVTPPPTPNPEFIQQVVKPKVVPPPPPPKKVVKQEPRPQPKFTAPNAHGQGISNALSVARVGSSGLPAPSYPVPAKDAGQQGTVTMHVTFGADGAVASADVVGSSGYAILDSWTRNFIFGHWKNASLANQTVHVPVVYDLSQPSSAH